jgi:hypothetical protein
MSANSQVMKFPEPYPWCLTCGFQHSDDQHCPGCTGDHSTRYCMPPALAEELAGLDDLRRRVEEAAAQLFILAIEVLRSEDGR